MTFHQTGKRAFTIVELLIAATITVLIVVMLGTMFGSLSNTAARANQRTDSFREARAAIHLMERDFTGVVSAKPTAYFVINNDTSNNSGSQARHLYGLISTKNQPPNAAPSATGDMCAVGYYCGWNGTSYRLLRHFEDSVATYGKLQTAFKANGYAGISALYNLSANDEVLAANCWNLMVTAYDSSGNVINPLTLASGEMTTTAPYTCNPSASTETARPAAIEISFKAMSPAAARTAIANGAGFGAWMANDEPGASATDKSAYQRFIAPNVYQFKTRITL